MLSKKQKQAFPEIAKEAEKLVSESTHSKTTAQAPQKKIDLTDKRSVCNHLVSSKGLGINNYYYDFDYD